MRDPRRDPRVGDVLYTPVGQLLVVDAVFPTGLFFRCDEILRFSPLELWRVQSKCNNLFEEIPIA